MVFGTGTSHFQIEEAVASSWSEFVAKDGSKIGKGVLHEQKWKEDADYVIDLGVDYYKMSLAWSKLQTKPFDKLDSKEKQRYHKLFKYLVDNGVKPNITLHHFDNPSWFDQKNGFLNKDSIDAFVDFAEKSYEEFGEYTDLISTFNEISTDISLRYGLGAIPNNKGHSIKGPLSVIKGLKLGDVAIQNMSEAHHAVYDIIKHKNSDVKVGFTEQWRPFEAYHSNYFLNLIEKVLIKTVFEKTVLNAWDSMAYKNGELKTDFLGMQYYGPYALNVLCKDLVTKNPEKPHDFLWNIDANLLSEGIDELAQRIPEVDIYVTEIGCATNSMRENYLKEHLGKIVSDDRVKGVFVWSLLDNFELLEGYSIKFGLIDVDRENSFKRTPKKDYYFFKKFIEDHKN